MHFRAHRSVSRAVRVVLARVGILGLAGALSACQSLLPESAIQTQVAWESFEQARTAIDNIRVGHTRRETLTHEGIDPYHNPAVTLLSYPDIVQRFAAGSSMAANGLDPGVKECLHAGKRCVGYAIAVRRTRRDRVGNFWLDSLNFRRETDVSGWSFNALVILVDDLVVFTVYGGQPQIREREVLRNPLGPLQTWGEHMPSILR